jgi:hypothetical protein
MTFELNEYPTDTKSEGILFEGLIVNVDFEYKYPPIDVFAVRE